MAAKLIALYKQPPDAKEFDKRYFGEHIALAMKMPGIQLIEVSRVLGAPGGEPAYYLMAELYFPDMETLQNGLRSPEGNAAGKNVMSFAGELVTMMFAEVHKN